MTYKKYLLSASLAGILGWAQAQESQLIRLNQSYKDGLNLLAHKKYVAASEQFSVAEKSRYQPSESQSSSASLTLMQENARFYKAVCALELNQIDAKSMFEGFIHNYPLNPNTKLAYYYLGKISFNQEDYDQTIQWFEKVNPLSLSAKDRIVYQFMQAYCYFLKEDYAKAEPLFETVKEEESPYQEDARYYFAYISYMNKSYKTALNNFEKLKGSKKFESSYPYYITSMYYLDGRYDAVLSYAVPILENTQQLYANELKRLVGAAYYQKGIYEKASEYFEAYNANVGYDKAADQDIYQYGFTLYKLQKYEKAAAVLKKIREGNIFMQSGMFTLGEISIQLKDKPSARAAFFRASRLDFDKQIQEDALLNYAKLSYALDFQQQALGATQDFMTHHPKSRRINEAKTLLGEILLSSKNYAQALEILEKIKDNSEESKAAYQKATYFRGLEFYNERAFPNALSNFIQSKHYPIDHEIAALNQYWMGESMYELRKYKEAEKALEAFLLMPGASQTKVYNYSNYALGYATFNAGNYDKSVMYFTKFLQGNDNDQATNNDATLRLADSYFMNKSYNLASLHYDKITQSGVKSQDYALFQKGMIAGLLQNSEEKIALMQDLIHRFPNSNYADDAGFEMAYTYFNKGNTDKAKNDLEILIRKYPYSSYIPKALTTIGLAQYSKGEDEAAIATFKDVISKYPSSEEAKVSLESIKNIYTDNGNAQGFLDYAASTNIGNYSQADQDQIMFQSAYNLFLKGNHSAALEALDAYFSKFPKPIHDKHARFIRAECLVALNKGIEAIQDYNYILNDWTSEYTERSLLSISKLYLKEKKYHEAIVYLKRLETTSDYKEHYNYALNNLLNAYTEIHAYNDMLKYANLVVESEKASESEKINAHLIAGKAYLGLEQAADAEKEFTLVNESTKSEAAAEAKYHLAWIQFVKKDYKISQKICFEIIKELSNYDYWVAKSFILLADNYVALKDEFQAKSTLESIIDNYPESDDGILSTAKAKLEEIKK